jgi:sulfate adenylyltransferase
MIEPHGGKLVDRMAPEGQKEQLREQAASMPRMVLNARETADLEMIATGAMSPLEGFMTEDEYKGVLNNMRLPGGLIWSLPVCLAQKKDSTVTYQPGQDIALYSEGDELYGILHLKDMYEVDKKFEAEKALGTSDPAHPGVQYLDTVGDIYLGGPITCVQLPKHDDFHDYRLAPKQTRQLFKDKGWETVVAFQTRNPIHRAHEYLQKCALEIVDGLLIHPLMGETKKDDIPGDVRWKCYQVLLDGYYPTDRVAISIFPAAMRYAGPREAIFHALVRRNYGCTHFIVGRDHAGVGDYYGTYDAQEIFEQFDPEEIHITPLKFEHSFFCKKCDGMASGKTCPHGKEDRIFLSGTKVREMLSKGEVPPVEFTRSEVAQVLIDAMSQKG